MLTWIIRGFAISALALVVYELSFGGITGCPTSAEKIMARSIAGLIENYQKKHEGVLPRNWDELQELVSRPIDDCPPFAFPTKRYALLSPTLKFDAPLKGELVLINRNEIWDESWGRRLIFRREDGSISSMWMKESEVKALFASIGASLPAPDGLPENPAATKARWISYFWNAAMAAFAAVVLYLFWRLMRLELPWEYDN